MDWRNRISFLLVVLFCVANTSCLRYSFTGTSIPEGVNTIYIPFFPDQSNSGFSDLSDRLNEALIDRFINSSKLQLASNENDADAVIDGSIVSYSNRPFSIGGDEEADQNQIQIAVRATFQYKGDPQPLWSDKNFSSTFTFDPTEDPIGGETDATEEVLEQIANNMFNDAVSSW
ncbi:MAG: hypothetical protein ED557_06570 [Balneola sp.]|nr:MAG: hypothetical protein ED557_06570 [Balneola sp.]